MQNIPYEDRLLASHVTSNTKRPFITIAIPHYERRRYLEVVLASLFAQNYHDFEILISDDNSPDDSRKVIPTLLQQSGCLFRYYLQPANLRYDRNIRFLLDSAWGQYVFLLGNDDALNNPDTLQQVSDGLYQLGLPKVAFTNYADWTSGAIVRRVSNTCLWAGGPETALQFFHAFTFVSGIIFDQTAAKNHETNKWDASTFYQIYLATRIIASGEKLATLNICTVRQNVTIDNQIAPTYVAKLKDVKWSFQPRTSDMDWVIHVTVDATLPYIAKVQYSKTLRYITTQILINSYLPWLFEYRRVANWSYAVGLVRGMWLPMLLARYSYLQWPDYILLWALYVSLTTIGLVLPARPARAFHALKRVRQWTKSL